MGRTLTQQLHDAIKLASDSAFLDQMRDALAQASDAAEDFHLVDDDTFAVAVALTRLSDQLNGAPQEATGGPTLCASCGSPRLIGIRKDSDWGDGGDQWRVNKDSAYRASDPETGPLDIDINYTTCLACGQDQ